MKSSRGKVLRYRTWNVDKTNITQQVYHFQMLSLNMWCFRQRGSLQSYYWHASMISKVVEIMYSISVPTMPVDWCFPYGSIQKVKLEEDYRESVHKVTVLFVSFLVTSLQFSFPHSDTFMNSSLQLIMSKPTLLEASSVIFGVFSIVSYLGMEVI